MTSDAQTDYFLVDPGPIAAEAPYTFFLPDQSAIAGVGVGDTVKLIFEYTGEVAEYPVERMWVIVSAVGDDHLTGTLGNDPYEPSSPLKLGDQVQFGRHHIISILEPKDGPDHPAPQRRQYWDRCLVDSCVLAGEQPVEYLYREAPDVSDEDDDKPDSGWRIRGRQGSATDDEMDARKASWVALGAVLNRDDSWLGYIDYPVGTRLIRNFTTGEYQPAA